MDCAPGSLLAHDKAQTRRKETTVTANLLSRSKRDGLSSYWTAYCLLLFTARTSCWTMSIAFFRLLADKSETSHAKDLCIRVLLYSDALHLSGTTVILGISPGHLLSPADHAP